MNKPLTSLSDADKLPPAGVTFSGVSRKVIQRGVVSIASLLILALVAVLTTPRLALLLLGVALGVTLKHGWLWIIRALLCSALGLRWRPRFGLSNR